VPIDRIAASLLYLAELKILAASLPYSIVNIAILGSTSPVYNAPEL